MRRRVEAPVGKYTDAEIGRKVSRSAKDLAKIVDALLQDATEGHQVPFLLVMLTYPRATYVASVKREDAIRELKRLLKYWEEGGPDVAAHELQS